MRDPLSEKFNAIAEASSDAERVNALLTLKEIFGDDLPQNPVFVDAIAGAYRRITRLGARQAVIETLKI